MHTKACGQSVHVSGWSASAEQTKRKLATTSIGCTGLYAEVDAQCDKLAIASVTETDDDRLSD